MIKYKYGNMEESNMGRDGFVEFLMRAKFL